MRPRSLLAAVILLLAATTLAFADEGLTELARIQTGLNRVAAGLSPEAEPSDLLGRVVAAFAAGWATPDADPARAEPILREVEAEIARRAEKLVPGYRDHFSFDLGSYLAKLEAATKASSDPLVRFILTLHSIDAILIREGVNPWGLDYERRNYVQFPSHDGVATGAWLRVPCRTLPGREADFRKAIAALGELAPVLDCPGSDKRPPDLDALAAFARNPAAAARSIARYVFTVRTVPPKPTSPRSPPAGAWSHETAVAFMARDPRRAEARLKQAITPGQKLDYALFLFTFHSPSHHRNVRINRLLADIAGTKPGGIYGDSALTPSFDGSMQSMVRDLTIPAINEPASQNGTYAIPCAVLVRMPALIKALEPQYGGGRDSWLPKSGCAQGRGSVPSFPEAEVRAFEKAAVAPTHDFIRNFEGSLVATLVQGGVMQFEIVRLNPRAVLADRNSPAASTPPYLVWSYLALDNKRIQARTQLAFRRAEQPLAAYYQRKGLSARDAKRAADAGLRSIAYGWDCGGAAPVRHSFRTLLLDGAPLDRIKALANSGAWRNASVVAPFDSCAEYAGKDPLIHVAVVRPDVLPFLWAFAAHEPGATAQADLELDPETRNAFGKTPLMTAVQFDQARSMRLLLAHGADPNARTNATSTSWALRTPLMYAAANASLPTIKMLLNAGADPQAADSKGARALHYLLGYGPVPANPRLSPRDLAEATRLLY